MKKFIGMSILILITALLTFGCSGGGGGSAANPAGGGDDSHPPADAGYLVITFAEAQTPMKARSAAVSSTLPYPDMARVVIRMISTVTGPVYDEDGNEIGTSTTTSTTYKNIVDISVPGSETITLPPGTGYIVDVISYKKRNSYNDMLKYGNLPSIDIVSGETTTAALTLNPINATISAPASIDSGSAYTVTINNNAFPLRSDKKNLRSSYSTISDLYSYSSSSTSFLVTAPTITIGQSATQYFQGLFFIDDALLDPVKNPTTDDWRYWTYYYPNPDFSDPEVKTTITPPGGFSIIITL